MRGEIKKMRLTDHSSTTTTSDDPFKDGERAEGCDINGGGGEIESDRYHI